MFRGGLIVFVFVTNLLLHFLTGTAGNKPVQRCDYSDNDAETLDTRGKHAPPADKFEKVPAKGEAENNCKEEQKHFN
jgi:hypothetical protein